MSEKTSTKLNVGVDLGTSNLLIYVEGKGTLFNEPSFIAIDKTSRKVVSVGFDASELVGKVHDKIEVVKPLSGGVIADVDMIKELLIFTLEKIFEDRVGEINKLLICIPSEITETEKDAIRQLGMELGIQNTVIDEEIKAAAIGGGVDIYTPSGHMIIDIGGGTTDFGVLSLGDVVLSKAIKTAGEYFDRQITSYIKEKHQLEIGAQTAEKIKIHLASLTGDYPSDEEGNVLSYFAMGRNLVSGLPSSVEITAQEIREVLLECFESIKSTLIATLEQTPPELAGDLVDNGILLSGGGSKIKGVKEYLEEIAKVDVHLSEHPLTAVVDGTKRLIRMEKKHYFGEYLKGA